MREYKLFGTTIRVRLGYLVVMALLAWPRGSGAAAWKDAALWCAVATVSILVHEFGHAVAMRSIGCMPWIELHALGGLTHWGSDADHTTRRDRIVVSLA